VIVTALAMTLIYPYRRRSQAADDTRTSGRRKGLCAHWPRCTAWR